MHDMDVCNYIILNVDEVEHAVNSLKKKNLEENY